MRIPALFIVPFLAWLVLTSPRKTRPRPTPGMIPPAVSEISASDVQPFGCPSKIPITMNQAIVAGKTYDGKGNNVPELSCNGKSKLWYKDTKYDAGSWSVLFGSVIVNPGCTLILVTPWDSQRLTGPKTNPNPKPDISPGINGIGFRGTIFTCGGIPCVWTLIWTCKQSYPSCEPDDKWQIITKLDNSANISAQFTYEKTVGTTWSQSMTESRSVSTTVSASISAAFWGVTATMGISGTTGYDWKTTDTKTKSESQSFKVSVEVPPKSTFTIEAVVGFCGGSTIHTQMFRILDSDNVILRTYQRGITSYDLTK
eukprot:GFUD01090206.1.p1 GENE.GFUD01090206.1~~GFUD01090206.1.p1  ORF type:complete len:313 (+),score=21.68 GFUD01090206.1:80-1018(+)